MNSLKGIPSSLRQKRRDASDRECIWLCLGMTTVGGGGGCLFENVSGNLKSASLQHLVKTK